MGDINKEEFIKLINDNRLKMYKTAISILKNEEDANDAIQDALYSAYKNYNNLKEKSFFTTWIIRILINKCYDIINKKGKIIYIDGTITQNTVGYNDTYNVENNLEWVLEQLDKDLREITVLYYYDDISITEISNMLNIPTGTVKSRLSRARTKILKLIEEQNSGGDK